MNKKVKICFIIVIILFGIISVDTLQAIILKHKPFISIKEKLKEENLIYKGLFINTYYCKNDKDLMNIYIKSKFSKFTCPIIKDANKEEIIDENQIIINELDSYLQKNSKSNFQYKFQVKFENNEYYYNGKKYDDIYNGVYKTSNKKVKYQIENNICYDLDSKKEIFNVHYNVNIGYIDMNLLSNTLKNSNTMCFKNDGLFECNLIDNNEEIELIINIQDENVKSVVITNYDTIDYRLEYSNFDKIEKIDRIIEYYRGLNVYFDESNEIINKRIDDFGVINYYKIKNFRYKAKNTIKNRREKIEYLNEENFDDFLKCANYKIEKYNSIKYIFNDDLIVYVVDESNEKNVYVSLEKYNNDILELIFAD